MKLFATTAAFVLFSTGLSLAAVDTDALIGTLQSQGYTRIEVKNGPTQVKVEAIRGTEKVEVIYDRTSGAVLKSETEAVEAGEDIGPGISIRNRDEDFLDEGDQDEDDSDDSADDSDDVSDDSSDDADDSSDDSDDSSDETDENSDDSDSDEADDDNDDENDDENDDDSGDDDSGDDDSEGHGSNDD